VAHLGFLFQKAVNSGKRLIYRPSEESQRFLTFFVPSRGVATLKGCTFGEKGQHLFSCQTKMEGV
jgi:hypothetical protein